MLMRENAARRGLSGHLCILVVDDDPRVLGAVSDILQLDDHEVSTADDGFEAFERIKARHYDLLITDLGMPGMSGIELAVEAHKIQPGLPVIVVTGYGARITQTERDSAEIVGVIDKPFRISELQRLCRVTH